MNYTQETQITVYNENKGKIFAQHFEFEEGTEEMPSITTMRLGDIKAINAGSNIFRNGLLTFEPELEDEILKQLNIVRKGENYISYKEIEEIILNPTKEGLDRLLAVTSVVTMDKIRGKLVEFNNSGEYNIVQNVFDVINARYLEIGKGTKKTEIVIKKKKNESESKTTLTKKASTKKDSKEEIKE